MTDYNDKISNNVNDFINTSFVLLFIILYLEPY